MKVFIENNKGIIFLFCSWLIGIVLIINFHEQLFCSKMINVNGYQYSLIVLGILLIILPFLEKIKIGNLELINQIDKANNKIEFQIERIEAKIPKDKINILEKESEDINKADDEPKWKIAKLRIEIEGALRIILKDMLLKSEDEIKFLGLKRLFEIYINENPDAKVMKETFGVFNTIANSVIHGQNISYEQTQKGVELGLNIMRYLKLKRILSQIDKK